ncbi:MAG: hypothetical protein HC880_20715, partial [Bacteroidia bacterium]|nr:hypothetical protein [Bacteroidia bacterium]
RFPVHQIGRQVIIKHPIEDIILNFDEGMIDSRAKLYGKQFLEVEIRLNSDRNTLLDNRTIQEIVVCPGTDSPRSAYYNTKNCSPSSISLNNYLRTKIYELDEWATIEITIRHKTNEYNGEGFSKRMDIILRTNLNFDLDVSFPAGLVIKRAGEEGFGQLGGISMAVIAQFGFYHPEKINKLRPYKIGAGFLALNAFNFSENNQNRDVGLVVLGSLYPIQAIRKTKTFFPDFMWGVASFFPKVSGFMCWGRGFG